MKKIEIPLSQFCTVVVGKDKPNFFSEEKNEEYNIPVYANGIENDGIVGYTNKAIIQQEAVTVSARGNVGTAFYRKEPFVPIIRLLVILADKKHIDTKYLYYVLKNMNILGVGSIQQQLTRPDMEKKIISIFEDVGYQKKIANFLSSIDDKIENNKKIICELESMAKTIYDYWFLQYEFPNEDGKPYKSSGGEMIWNDEFKKEIPSGFYVEKILNCCDVVDCLHSKKPEYHFENEKYYLLTLENLKNDGNIDLLNKFYISKNDYENWTSRIEIKENDFVVTNAGRAGDICKIPKGIKCAIGRNITAIRPKTINPYYLRQFFKSNYIKEQIQSNLDCGSFFMSFNVKSIKQLFILMPNEKIYTLFNQKIEKYISIIENCVKQNEELTKLRDELLPLLMNGQVGFKD